MVGGCVTSLQTVMKPYRITIHCTDTPNGQFVREEALRTQSKARGFDDIPYHGFINPDGEWINGRPLNRLGAHVKNHNGGNIGISLVGTDLFTKDQFNVLKDKINNICMTYDIKPWNIYTHAQFDTAIAQGKTCPNVPINKLMYFLSTNDYSCLREHTLEVGK